MLLNTCTLMINKIGFMFTSLALTDPFDILSETSGYEEGTTVGSNLYQVNWTLGFTNLAKVINLMGVIAAVIVIISSLITLLVVNHPITMQKVKSRVLQAFAVIIVLASLPLIMDTVLTILIDNIL